MSMSFSSIPSDIRVPLFYAEVDNSMANSGTSTLRRLLVGQVNDDVTGPEVGRLVLVSQTSQARTIAGDGSMLAAMHARVRAIDVAGEVWCLPLKVSTGVVASGTVTVTGAASAAGLLNLYVAGTRVQTAVVVGADASAVAAGLAAAVNAAVTLPVTATAAAGVVTLKAKFKGELGNDIQLQLNRLGRVNGEVTPAGLTAVVAPMASGAGTPDMAAALAALGDEEFEFIAQPWTDPATLDAWKDTMDDSAGRWSWAKQIYGHVYSARRGTLGQLVAAGRLRNDPHVSVHGFETGVPQPAWELAAAWMARTAVFISADPARPTQTGVLVGISPAEASDASC